ncbi:alpha/beta fold hydrolase [Actinomadura rupiterrae]|uniref:alpha/beta fold hydrolase n=1 Tax=Actinomadura rupiterrae TaxID=559627 RepID=UPI0020A40131|nr:alpha/beta fold hydrolase [Actinomadura rupiterrae]MCP2341422.1 pimeloyl-ACP methyl ester carboxylesterase [Actinomadura rupiterrae]
MFQPQFVDVDDVLLHVETAGPEDGPPVLFLHGWPDLWLSFDRQMTALAAQGYRVLAPDQRGYGLSSKPTAVADYAMPNLTKDIALLIERQELAPVHLVGHDWGAAVAWTLATERPDLVRSLTVVNCPHPQVLAEALMRRPSQMLRSWYMLAFQIPGLAEAVLGARDHAVLTAMLRHGAGLDDADLERHRAVWRHPGTVQRPLFWYRAMFRTMLASIRAERSAARNARTSARAGSSSAHDPSGRGSSEHGARASERGARSRREPLVRVPTQIIWGGRDGAFSRSLAEPSAAMCEQAVLHRLDARHWPHREQPGRVTGLLTSWFARHADLP